MRMMPDNTGSNLTARLAVGLALLPLVGGAAIQPATAMPAGVHTPAMGALASGVRRVDDRGDPVNGRRIFLRENCYICHGGRAGGGMCLNLRDARPGADLIKDTIEKGNPKGMPSFSQFLEDRDIQDVVAYFASLRTPGEPTFTHWWEPGVPAQ